jgi:hypothetical protein
VFDEEAKLRPGMPDPGGWHQRAAIRAIRAHDTLAFWLRRDSARRQCHTTKWWKDVIFRELVGTAWYAR